jgi:hypothetical protein
MEVAAYVRYTVRGIGDCPQCDNCGKTNLKSTVILETECGALVNFGSDCAASSLRQDYQGKRYPISRAAVISMGESAKRGETFACLSVRAVTGGVAV